MKNSLNYWQMSSLGENVKFISGGTPSKSKEEYWNGNISWVSSGSMSENRIYETDLKITQEGLNSGSKLVSKNTIFVVVRGMSLAKEFRVALAMQDMAFNQDIKAIVPLKKDLDSIFLFYYLLSQAPPIRDSASEAAHGTKKLDMAVLEQWPLPIPPFETQKKIAAILSVYDDLIEINKQRIALLEKMAEEIYREWFVRFRFPDWQNTEFEKGIPKAWEEIEISKFVNFKSGFAFKSETYSEQGKFGIVTIKNVHDGKFIAQCTDYIEKTPSNLPKHCFIQQGDILMSLTGNVGRVCLAYGDNILLNQRVVILEPKTKTHSPYIYRLFRDESMLYFCEMIATGAAQQNLSPVKLGKQKLFYPTDSIINQFCEKVLPMMNQSINLNIYNQKLEDIKNTLLPRLISGKLSVENLDIEFPPSMQ